MEDSMHRDRLQDGYPYREVLDVLRGSHPYGLPASKVAAALDPDVQDTLRAYCPRSLKGVGGHGDLVLGMQRVLRELHEAGLVIRQREYLPCRLPGGNTVHRDVSFWSA